MAMDGGNKSEPKRKHQVEQVCEIQNCDHKCLNMRPKHCEKKNKCIFVNKNICAFGHDTLEKENDNDEKVEMILDKLGKLKKKLSYDKEPRPQLPLKLKLQLKKYRRWL